MATRPSIAPPSSVKKQLAPAPAGDLVREWVTTDSLSLHYPELTRRFYAARGYRSAWSVAAPGERLWQAVVILENALQYGLQPNDYHPGEIDAHHIALLQASKDLAGRCKADVYLTDAMLAMIVHLHYGKVNPKFPGATLEREAAGFADSVLSQALANPLKTTVESVQPRSAEYRVLQEHLRLMTGQYVGDSYEPEKLIIRRLAANLERLRWENGELSPVVLVNIPSGTLLVADSIAPERFPIVTGSSAHPSPLASGILRGFTAFPAHVSATNTGRPQRCRDDRGAASFALSADFPVGLHGFPGNGIVGQKIPEYSEGCILLEKPLTLATALLRRDARGKALNSDWETVLRKQRTREFQFTTPLSFTVRYQTLEVKDGLLVALPDPYEWDAKLSAVLLGSDPELDRLLTQLAKKTRKAWSDAANSPH